MNPVPLTSISLRDTRLACLDRGTGDPLVFVHGSLGSLHDFQQQADFFSSSYRVICYSRRFHPPNPMVQDDQTYSLSVHAADLADAIETLAIPPATVIASSYGGYVSLCCAIRHPGLMRGLVLGEPPMLPLLQKTHEGRAALEEFEARTLRPSRAALEKGDLPGGVKQFFDGIAGKPGSFDMLSLLFREKLTAAAPALRLEFLTEFGEYMPAIADDQIRSVGIPVLLLNGERSPRLFSLITDELERLLPDNYRVSVPGSGHSMQLGNPAFYNGVVQEFLGSY